MIYPIGPSNGQRLRVLSMIHPSNLYFRRDLLRKRGEEMGKGMINGEFVCLGSSLAASFLFLHPCSLTLRFWYSFSGERPPMAFITMTPVPRDSNWPKFSWLPFIKWHHPSRLICSIHLSLVALSLMHHFQAPCTWQWRPGRCQSSFLVLWYCTQPQPNEFCLKWWPISIPFFIIGNLWLGTALVLSLSFRYLFYPSGHPNPVHQSNGIVINYSRR